MLTIRTAVFADAPVLCAAERETAQTPGLLVSQPHELTVVAFEQKIQALSRAGIYLVAESDGAAVGHALLEPMPLQAMSHVFSLTIVVHPGHVGRGIGKAMMTALMAWADASAVVEKVELRVREGNAAARALYQAFGFVEEGRLSGRIKVGKDRYIADILMAKMC